MAPRIASGVPAPMPQAPAADECGDQTDDTYPMKRLPKMKPDRYCRQRDKGNAEDFDDLKAMFVIVMMVVFMIATFMMFH